MRVTRIGAWVQVLLLATILGGCAMKPGDGLNPTAPAAVPPSGRDGEPVTVVGDDYAGPDIPIPLHGSRPVPPGWEAPIDAEQPRRRTAPATEISTAPRVPVKSSDLADVRAELPSVPPPVPAVRRTIGSANRPGVPVEPGMGGHGGGGDPVTLGKRPGYGHPVR